MPLHVLSTMCSSSGGAKLYYTASTYTEKTSLNLCMGDGHRQMWWY